MEESLSDNKSHKLMSSDMNFFAHLGQTKVSLRNFTCLK